VNTGRFNDNAKEDVRSRIDIVQVIGRYVNLKPSGQTMKGLCPFHNEKTPSFHVNASRGFFHCFGCGKGGDVFTFLQEIEGIGFGEALKRLADECGVSIAPPRTDMDIQDAAVEGVSLTKGEMQRIHEIAAVYFYNQVKPNQRAIDYFKTRGLKGETVREFKLGYAPEGWSGLISFCEPKGITADMLVACGLAVRKDGGSVYDRFRERIMFSLCDLSSRVIGFAGRGMDDEAQPKYLNSPETLLYHKNRFLYGLDKSRAAIRDTGRIMIVEGYMDYLTLFQAGVRNIAASSGTALTQEHGQLISRFTSKVVLVFDGDAAGQTAARRGVFMLAPLNLDVSILVLPGDEDPDSYVKNNGPEAFLDLLKNTRSSTDFIIDKMIADHDGKTAQGKMTVIEQLVPLVQAMTNPIARMEFKKELAERLQVESRIVYRYMPDAKKSAGSKPPALKTDTYAYSIEGSFLRILISNPELIPEAQQYITPETITDVMSENIYSLIIKAYSADKTLDSLLDTTDDPELKRVISSMLVMPVLQEHLKEELVQKIIHIRAKFLKARLHDIKLQIKENPQQRVELLQALKDYSTQLKELSD
jgi:DNA primase